MNHLIIQGIGLVWIILLTIINWKWFKLNWKTGPFFHLIFGSIWLAPVFIVGFVWQHDIWLVLLLILQRFVFFNPLLNIERSEPFFYLSTAQGKSSSWWDALEIKYASAYRDIWFFCLGSYFLLQFFIH